MLDPKIAKSNTGTDYVNDRVDGAHFVKMDLVGPLPMNQSLGLSKTREDLESCLLYPRIQTTRLDHLPDLRKVTVAGVAVTV